MILNDLISNHMLIAPLIAWLTAQLTKWIISAIIDKKFTLERLFGDGGMPSSHSATVITLSVLCGWCCGFASAAFAISLIFASVVMRDAIGVRRETGKHATIIKTIADNINNLFSDESEQIKAERLKLFVGHTPLQVFFGVLLGITVSVIYILLFQIPYAYV